METYFYYHQNMWGSRFDLVVDQIDDAVEYLSGLFGPFPFETLTPWHTGTGLLTGPDADQAQRHTGYSYSDIAEGAALQWLERRVTPLSSRDRWVTAGLAHYAGLGFAHVADSASSGSDLLERERWLLSVIPGTGNAWAAGTGIILMTGYTPGAYQSTEIGPLGTIGPLTRGRRLLDTAVTVFRQLNEVKGGLVFRMLEFLFTDMEYSINRDYDGSELAQGTLFQSDVSEDFLMPLPVEIELANGQTVHEILVAEGSETPFEIRLPASARTITLDPELWVLSEKTETQQD